MLFFLISFAELAGFFTGVKTPVTTNSIPGGKTPTVGQIPTVSGAGLGVSPAHSYVMNFRMCRKANGITYPIAICEVCKKIVEPVNREYSKTGSHGKFYYMHEHPLVFVTLIQSNSGKRRVVWTGGYVKILNEVVEYMWVISGQDIKDIIETIQAYLKVM